MIFSRPVACSSSVGIPEATHISLHVIWRACSCAFLRLVGVPMTTIFWQWKLWRFKTRTEQKKVTPCRILWVPTSLALFIMRKTRFQWRPIQLSHLQGPSDKASFFFFRLADIWYTMSLMSKIKPLQINALQGNAITLKVLFLQWTRWISGMKCFVSLQLRRILAKSLRPCRGQSSLSACLSFRGYSLTSGSHSTAQRGDQGGLAVAHRPPGKGWSSHRPTHE